MQITSLRDNPKPETCGEDSAVVMVPEASLSELSLQEDGAGRIPDVAFLGLSRGPTKK